MPDALEITEAEICVDRLAECQRALQLNDAAFVRRFGALGSARTWRRLALKDWPSVPVDVWLPKLREVVAQLEAGPAAESLSTPLSALSSEAAAPVVFVTRHLQEADRCRREANLTLARSHCRAARQAIENFQRSLTP